ncbi:natterin-3-like [Lycodopsis pacificus]
MMARPALAVLLLNPSLEDMVPDITDEESAYTATPKRAETEKPGRSPPLSFDEPNLCPSPPLSFDEPNLCPSPLSTFDEPNLCPSPLSTFDEPNLCPSPLSSFDEPILCPSPSSSFDTRTMCQSGLFSLGKPNLCLSPSLSFDQTNLEWQTFDGSLPNGAVSIFNGYAERTEYVSRYGCEAGFYNPDMGPYCHYPCGQKEHLGSPFEILVNKDNFEFLEWKKGSKGSVPQNSVKTVVDNNDFYVGKNKYGLGKVHQVFFLPWKGKEYWYKDYEVLTFNSDVSSEHISDVKYETDGVEIVTHPPETMTKTTLVNNSCQTVTQTATLSKTIQVEERWDTSSSLTLGVNASITAGIPLIGSADIEFSASATLQFTKGTTHTESKEHNVAVESKVPPKHSCTVSMVGYKREADIPYTARLSRTYSNGNTTWTSISGTYKRVQVTEVRSVVDPCEPLPDA